MDTPDSTHIIPFPDLDALQVEDVVRPRRHGPLYGRRHAAFMNRLIAFYVYVRDAAGAADFPHPSGVRVSEEQDRALMDWCIAAAYKKLNQRQRDREFGMSWLDKGPSTLGDVPVGEIHLIIDRAWPDGLDHAPQQP
jgi:hypothetical protein